MKRIMTINTAVEDYCYMENRLKDQEYDMSEKVISCLNSPVEPNEAVKIGYIHGTKKGYTIVIECFKLPPRSSGYSWTGYTRVYLINPMNKALVVSNNLSTLLSYIDKRTEVKVKAVGLKASRQAYVQELINNGVNSKVAEKVAKKAITKKGLEFIEHQSIHTEGHQQSI